MANKYDHPLYFASPVSAILLSKPCIRLSTPSNCLINCPTSIDPPPADFPLFSGPDPFPRPSNAYLPFIRFSQAWRSSSISLRCRRRISRYSWSEILRTGERDLKNPTRRSDVVAKPGVSSVPEDGFVPLFVVSKFVGIEGTTELEMGTAAFSSAA